MRLALVAVMVPLALGGCINTRTVDTPAAASPQSVVVTPAPAPAPIVVCASGARPPCP